MSDPKKHHFVPEVILKRFTDCDGWLHSFFRRDPDKRVRKARPDSVFYQKHLYSIEERDGQRNPSLEKEYARLESEIGPILEKIESSVENDELPKLSRQERLIWHYFFASQFKRVPDFIRATELVDAAHGFFQETLNEFRQRYPHRAGEIDAISSEAPRFVKNAQVHALESVSKEVIDVLEARGLAFLKLTDANKSFAIGSRPVVQLAFKNGRTLRDQGTEMWLPVSSSLAVGVGHSDQSESIFFLSDHAAIRMLNLAIAKQSSHFASCSSALTKSLAFAR